MASTIYFKDVTLENLPAAAKTIADNIKNGATVLLEGEMGAGKTTLAKHLVNAMGSDDQVSSPTFSIVNQYGTQGGKTIYHFDFYRIDDPAEAFDMGYEEYFYGGATCIVEWGEKVEGLLPEKVSRIRIEKTPAGRDITFME